MKRSVRSEADCINEKKVKVTTATTCAVPSPIPQSSALQNIIGGSIETFFQEIYQIKPRLYHVNEDNVSSPELASVYLMGCDDLAHMLQVSQNSMRRYSKEISTESDISLLPLVFRNQEALQPDEVRDVYGNSPFAAYLDGCSIVSNHADLICPQLASLCLDLQKSLPHAYVNTYLTPPNTAAVKAHADDRDVLVIQIVGEKRWKVYDNPIFLPYTNEQVGKGNLPIPDASFKKAPLIDTTLKPGDVLYMPRGYVHEAFTKQDSLSFHATVAIATHDWSFSKTISSIVRQQLDKVPNFRMAVHPHIGTRSIECIGRRAKDELDCILKRSMEIIKSSVSVESIAEHLKSKYELHNNHVNDTRNHLIQSAENEEISKVCGTKVVGPEAAEVVVFGSETRFRASTSEEKASAPTPIAQHGRGLTVRPETCDLLLSILSTLQSDKEKAYTLRELKIETKKRQNYNKMVCDLSLLSFVRCCVALGAMALIPNPGATH